MAPRVTPLQGKRDLPGPTICLSPGRAIPPSLKTGPREAGSDIHAAVGKGDCCANETDNSWMPSVQNCDGIRSDGKRKSTESDSLPTDPPSPTNTTSSSLGVSEAGAARLQHMRTTPADPGHRSTSAQKEALHPIWTLNFLPECNTLLMSKGPAWNAGNSLSSRQRLVTK